MPLFLPPDCPSHHMTDVEIERRVNLALPVGTPRAQVQAWFGKCRLKAYLDRDGGYVTTMFGIRGGSFLFLVERSISITIRMEGDQVAEVTYMAANTSL